MSRIDNIKKYNEQQKINAENMAIQEQQTRETLIAQVRGLKPRIAELIETANACFENDVPIGWEGNAKTLYGKWDVCGFTADSTYHRVGFIVTRSNDKKTTAEMGILAGGACGSWNFATNGEDVVAYKFSQQFDEPLIKHLQQFVEDFDDFEKYFYAYVDKITGSVTDESPNTVANALYHIAKLQEQEELLKHQLSSTNFLKDCDWEVTGLFEDCYTDYSSARYTKKGNEYSLFTRSGKELGVKIEGQKGVYVHKETDPNDANSFCGEYFYNVEKKTYVRVGFVNKVKLI